MLTSPNHIQLNSHRHRAWLSQLPGCGPPLFQAPALDLSKSPPRSETCLGRRSCSTSCELSIYSISRAPTGGPSMFGSSSETTSAMPSEDNVPPSNLLRSSTRAGVSSIPKQFIFDPLRGADLWIRNQKFRDIWRARVLLQLRRRFLASFRHADLGRDSNPTSRCPPVECGKAIMLTQLLANCVNDIKRNKTYLAQEDMSQCELDVPRLKLRRPSPSLDPLCPALRLANRKNVLPRQAPC